MTAADRFWAKVRQDGDCWRWVGGTSNRGYGTFWGGERLVGAHRWAFEYLVAPIPANLHIDHLCRHPWCVNPYHMDPVPQLVNIQRGWAARPVLTHCSSGHEWTEANTCRWLNEKRGSWQRSCRACARARIAARRALVGAA